MKKVFDWTLASITGGVMFTGLLIIVTTLYGVEWYVP